MSDLEWAVIGALDWAGPCSMADSYRKSIMLWPHKKDGADAIGNAFLSLERKGYIERDDAGDPDASETWRPTDRGKIAWERGA